MSANLFVDKDDKSYKLKTDINIINERAVRMDVSTTLDLPEASILLTEDKIQYVLYQQKKFFTGRPNPHALDPVFPMAVDADTLVKLLQEEPPEGAKCQRDENGLKACSGTAGDVAYNVSWSKRTSTGPLAGRATRLELAIPQRAVSLKFYFNDWQRNVANAERLLTLQVPSGFKLIPVPQK